ncbi:MAG: hypothetical protein H0V66_05170 [Bdellovibrionales bacterium]|nr:hypothetical protein [Bdellovibrionales bacterium]
MGENHLTPELKEFINRNIPSIAQLELLFLFYSFPDKFWNNEELSKETRTNVSAVSRNLSQLLSRKLILKRDENYKYNPENQEINLQVQQFFMVYQERPVAVITFIYEKPRDVLQDFANAFKLKKD